MASLALALPIATASAARGASAAASNGCYEINFTWVCIDTGGGPGSPGGPGSGHSAKYACVYVPAPPAIVQLSGSGPPPPGYQWDIMTCNGSGGPVSDLILVSIATGRPAISPTQLLIIAIGDLSVPVLDPATAPPRGKDGLVGLPEWFWIPPSQWRKITITVTAGPVWATAAAIPTQLTYVAGGGQGSISCPGPGRPFDRRLPADRQHTACSYTYSQSSAGQPGHAYQAAVTVTWTISWTGSGGAGGLITNGFTTAAPFAVRIAQAEALVTRP